MIMISESSKEASNMIPEHYQIFTSVEYCIPYGGVVQQCNVDQVKYHQCQSIYTNNWSSTTQQQKREVNDNVAITEIILQWELDGSTIQVQLTGDSVFNLDNKASLCSFSLT